MPANPNYSVPIEQGGPFVLRPADPGAGASLSQLTVGHFRWEFHLLAFTLTTDANAANRRVTIQLSDVTGTFMSWDLNAQQTASLVREYWLQPGEGNAVTGIDGNLYGFYPRNLLLKPDVTLKILIQNIQVGDEITSAFFTGRRWVERSV